jgi:hypothetical protein
MTSASEVPDGERRNEVSARIQARPSLKRSVQPLHLSTSDVVLSSCN